MQIAQSFTTDAHKLYHPHVHLQFWPQSLESSAKNEPHQDSVHYPHGKP